MFTWSDTQGCEGTVIESVRSLWSAGVSPFLELWCKRNGHSSFDASVELAKSQFRWLFMADDLLRSGGCAPRRTISELSHILPQLQHHNDSLFLP